MKIVDIRGDLKCLLHGAADALIDGCQRFSVLSIRFFSRSWLLRYIRLSISFALLHNIGFAAKSDDSAVVIESPNRMATSSFMSWARLELCLTVQRTSEHAAALC